jgi:hypothetical protein
MHPTSPLVGSRFESERATGEKIHRQIFLNPVQRILTLSMDKVFHRVPVDC